MPGRGKQKGLLIVRVLQSVKKGDKHMNFSVTNKYWHLWNKTFENSRIHFFGAKYKQYYIPIWGLASFSTSCGPVPWESSIFVSTFARIILKLVKPVKKKKKGPGLLAGYAPASI